MLLPVAVLVVIIAKNIIGLPSFGTFVPALLVLAFSATGLLWGLLLLLAVLLVGVIARMLVDRLQLLHTPRLALVLAVVVASILAICFLAIGRGWIEAGNMALFPVVIIVCMVEQCYSSMQESGPKHTIGIALGTAIIVAAVYAVVTWPVFQAMVMVVPEVLFVVIAVYLAIGRYVGLRLGELLRFREILFSRSQVALSGADQASMVPALSQPVFTPSILGKGSVVVGLLVKDPAKPTQQTLGCLNRGMTIKSQSQEGTTSMTGGNDEIH